MSNLIPLAITVHDDDTGIFNPRSRRGQQVIVVGQFVRLCVCVFENGIYNKSIGGGIRLSDI